MIHINVDGQKYFSYLLNALNFVFAKIKVEQTNEQFQLKNVP